MTWDMESRHSLMHVCMGAFGGGCLSVGRQMLVPLNQSLYVPGKIVDADKLLVDIGTGYFVEKGLTQTKEYLDRKVSRGEVPSHSFPPSNPSFLPYDFRVSKRPRCSKWQLIVCMADTALFRLSLHGS